MQNNRPKYAHIYAPKMAKYARKYANKNLVSRVFEAFYAIIIETLVSGNQLMSQNVSPITIMAPKFNGKG